MDILIGIATTVFLFLLLLIAAVRDYQTREVSNLVWYVGLLGLPFTIFRIGTVGLWLVYGLQIVLVFLLVIFGFRIGMFGGADGKAILIIGLLYPWINLDSLWLVLAPTSILFGGFLLLGFNSLWLLFRNVLTWQKASKRYEYIRKPEKKTYWLTRRFSVLEAQHDQWNPVDVPLVVYFFIVYSVLLILTSMLF